MAGGGEAGPVPALEAEAIAAIASGDAARAVELILTGYGREIMRFLGLRHRSDADVEEVFSLFAEAVWRSALAFEGRSSVRTWCYAVARRVSLHHQRDARRREKRFCAFGDDPLLAEVEQRVRTETLPYLRTERREKLSALRDALPEGERELLVLRIDRRMSWSDIALIVEPFAAPPTSGELAKVAGRLRKQFQVVKDRLRTKARSEGLLGADDERHSN